MQDEDRQTREAFDAVTNQAIAYTPPRVEDVEKGASMPQPEVDRGLDPVEFARPSFESALERFRSAGRVDVDPEDPALFNAYRRSIDYLGDMALGGLDLSDAAFKAAVGIVAQALPENQERRFARDLVSMPEAFMGYSPSRIQSAADRVAAGVSEAGRRLNQAGPMPTTLGSNLGNLAARTEEPTKTSGRVTNPLLKTSAKAEGDLEDRVGRVLLDYYSPLVSAVEQMPIGKRGSTGQTIMAYLNKRAPNVSAQELNYTLSGLDPKKRYTKNEVMELLRPSTKTGFRARVLESVEFGDDGPTRYAGVQRQLLRDNMETDYFEILLENPGSEVDLPSHHDTDTFAHSRGSIREDDQGRYLLIEEIQSDALQNIGKAYSRDLDDTEGFVESFFDELFEDTPYDVVYTATSDIMNPRQGESREQVRQRIKDFYKTYDIEVSGRDARTLHADGIRKLTPSFNDNPEMNDANLDGFFDDVQNAALDLAEQKQLESYGEGDIPFSNTQYVRQLLLANIAKAKEEGINRVVIPSLKEIARQRVGTGNFVNLEDAEKALRSTYVDSVRKAINTLNTETQGQIKVGKQTLPYWDLTEPDRTRRSDGLLLDISNFDFDPRTQAARFAEGGVVSMEEQMSFFDVGGFIGDDAMRDPVSGNEVPSGSMASEVRDDVPAMLSEGEYVVPADVVRFFGVKFFEDLRNQAKSGLMDMERSGRIGGEPVGDPQDDLTPEELQMLAEISGMYGGGMVTKGYQTGGVVSQSFTPMPNYTTPGFSLFQTKQPTAAVPQTESVTLYGPNGEIVTLTLPTDQQRYNALIGQGYSTEQRVQQPAAQVGRDEGERPSAVASPRGLGKEAQRDFTPLESDVYNALLNDPLDFGKNALSSPDFSKFASGIGSLLGGPTLGLIGGAVGAGMTSNNVAQARAASQIAKAKGLDTTELDSQIDSYISSLPNLSRVASSDLLASGDAIAEKFLETARDMSLDWRGPYGKNPLTRDFFAEGPAGDAAFQKEMESVAPPGMKYEPSTGSYVRDENAPSLGERLGGTRISTGEGDTPVYRPSESTPRPKARPDRGGGTSSTTSSESKGFYESITGTKFKDTAVGKALGLGDDDSSSGESSSGGGGYGCYVATALTEEGYWSNTKKLRLIKWCMDTKPEGKFLTKLWRNGYVTFGKKVVAPFASNKVVKWLADGYYDSAVKGKKNTKALLGSTFFTVPSYSIGLAKAVTGKLVDIERT